MQVKCVFLDDYPQASCVLVSREYGNPVLTVIEYPQNTLFPVTVKVNRSTQITLSIFGKNGKEEIDLQPIVTKLVMASPVIISTTLPGKLHTEYAFIKVVLMICLLMIHRLIFACINRPITCLPLVYIYNYSVVTSTYMYLVFESYCYCTFHG